jgi:hypothetical protein
MAEIRTSRRAAFVMLWIVTIALVVIWDRNPYAFLASGFGFIAMLFAFSARAWWPWFAALCSAGFVVNESPVEAYLSVIRGALAQNAALDSGIVLSYELILPLFHLATFLFLCIGLYRSKRGG